MVNPKLTLGLNLKYINGIANFQVGNSSFNLSSVPSENILRVDGSYTAYSSGLGLLQGGLDTLAHAETRNMTSKNVGWAVDLGATYQLTDRLQLGFSILDLGGIKWANNAKEYNLSLGSATFESLGETNWNSANPKVDALADSLNKYFIAERKDIPKYRTQLPKQMYLTATYQLHRSAQATGIIFSEQFNGRVMPGFTAAVHKDFGRRIGASLSYTAINNSYANVGAGMSFRLTPFQLYVVTDNVIGALNRKEHQVLNARAGLNLMFGTIKKPTKLPY